MANQMTNWLELRRVLFRCIRFPMRSRAAVSRAALGRALAFATPAQKNAALEAMASRIDARRRAILEANKNDIDAARGRGRDDVVFVGFEDRAPADRKSTRLNSSHLGISYAVFCLKKKKNTT